MFDSGRCRQGNHFWLPCRHLPELPLLVTLSASSRITTSSYPVGIFPNYHFWLLCRHLQTFRYIICAFLFCFNTIKIAILWPCIKTSTNKTDRHDITEILLIMALNTTKLTLALLKPLCTIYIFRMVAM